MKNGGQLPINSAIKYDLLLSIHFVDILLDQCEFAGPVFNVVFKPTEHDSLHASEWYPKQNAFVTLFNPRQPNSNFSADL